MTTHLLTAAVVAVVACTARAADLDEDSLSVDTVVANALEHSPDGHMLRNALARAKLDRRAAGSAFEPRLYSSFNSSDRTGTELGSTFQVGVDKLLGSGSRIGIGYLNSRYGDRSLAELKLTYTLPFFGNKNQDAFLAVDEAALNESVQARRLQAGLEDLILRTVTGYYDLVLANGQLEVARSGVEAAGSLHRMAELESAASERGAMNARYAHLQVERARHGLGTAHHRRETAAARLRMLAGYAPSRVLRVPRTVVGIDHAPTEPLDELIERAHDVRTELVNLRAEIAHLERRRRYQANRSVAPVNVRLEASLTGDGRGIGSSFELDSPQIGIGMDVALGNRRARDLARQRLGIRLDDLRHALANLEYAVQADIQEAYFSRIERQAQLEFASKRMMLARDELSQAELKLATGLGDVREALDKQHALVEARHDLLASRAQYVVAGYRLDRSTGRLSQQWASYIDP